MKLLPALATLLAAVSINSFAAEVELNSSEIKQLLNGNTINGVHYQKKTVQYFSESGLTLWAGEGDKKPSEGQWKVENNEYCSDFGGGWGCYKIVVDAKQGVHYFIGEDFRAPFVSKQGYHFQF
ncbi:hypothetical protein EOPP23_05450 [Endozoicomonas sp. OPT23]|uniref:hypothetical protein n=1 Tax=Endozoicomonas sp. OPT23 TaxID=2072845 RepID=UPI00129B26DD|nr:hypothetical protein [Endozoicomonas sp. OPT23]MRI32429.1 hypothetical protein [Endozoicomonas sp. OPT23]